MTICVSFHNILCFGLGCFHVLFVVTVFFVVRLFVDRLHRRHHNAVPDGHFPDNAGVALQAEDVLVTAVGKNAQKGLREGMKGYLVNTLCFINFKSVVSQ